MARIWSASTIPPQLEAARAAGDWGLQHWMNRRRTVSLARPPPSNLSPKPSFSPGRLTMVSSSSVNSHSASASRHWTAMSLVVAGKIERSEV